MQQKPPQPKDRLERDVGAFWLMMWAGFAVLSVLVNIASTLGAEIGVDMWGILRVIAWSHVASFCVMRLRRWWQNRD